MWSEVPIEMQWKTAKAISFILLLLYPGLKTLLALNSKKKRGYWAIYWIGMGFLLPLYFIFNSIISLFPRLFTIGSIILIYRNGFFVQQIAIYIVTPIFSHFFEELDDLVNIVLTYSKKTIIFLLNQILSKKS